MKFSYKALDWSDSNEKKMEEQKNLNMVCA